MSRLTADQIAEVVLTLVGDIEAHGETHFDEISRKNQRTLTEVIDTLVYKVCKNTVCANRVEYSMRIIGEDAQEFLGYLVEEYDLNDYVEKDE